MPLKMTTRVYRLPTCALLFAIGSILGTAAGGCTDVTPAISAPGAPVSEEKRDSGEDEEEPEPTEDDDEEPEDPDPLPTPEPDPDCTPGNYRGRFDCNVNGLPIWGGELGFALVSSVEGCC